MVKKVKKRHIIFVSVLAFGLWSFTNQNNGKYFEILKNLDIFATLFKEVNAYYVDDVNPNTLMKTGIDAMLASLDPYTRYFPEDQIEDVRTETTGEYGGIGALVGSRDGRVMIIMPNKGFAADKAGLKRGDEIIAIDGLDVRRQYEKASEYLKGQSSSSVKVRVDRVGVGEMEFEVALEKIELPDVPYAGMINPEIGVVKLTGFTENASKEVKSALKELKEKGATKIILDLRGNPGGLLGEAVNISNLFIPKGQLVVTTKGKIEEANATYNTLDNPFDIEIPLVVLVNSTSASASEIVAGVMQDYDRGVLVGQKSFGKGLVQRSRPLSYNSQMKVTTAKYYTPSGRCIQALDYSNRNPDGSVGKFPDSLKTAFKTQNGRLVYDGGGVDPDFPVEKQRLAPITVALLANDFFFEFGNEYAVKAGTIETVTDFQVSDQIFNDFAAWLSRQDYNYISKLEKQLERLKIIAEEEGKLEVVQSSITSLENAVKQDQGNDLWGNKQEIKHFLREEFIARALLEEGQVAVSYQYDDDINKAVEVLSSSTLYQQTLAGQ